MGDPLLRAAAPAPRLHPEKLPVIKQNKNAVVPDPDLGGKPPVLRMRIRDPVPL